jgi:L-alanine-DL-glutamate epimerase-like enolase superfamily enzyme
MKISKVDIYVLTIPYERETKVAYHTYTETTNVYVKIHTDDGIVGIGEASPAPAFTGESVGSLVDAVQLIASKILGMDPFEIGKINTVMAKYTLFNNAAKCAVDTALHDIVARACNVPLYNLLGGAYRKEFSTQRAIPILEPKEMADMAVKLVGEGYTVFEVKVGLEPKRDVDRVVAIEDAIGDKATLIVDANCGWTPMEAVNVLKQIQHYTNILAEQPTRSLEGLAWIRDKISLPIIADESIFTAQDALNIIKKDAADIISMKILKAGGFTECLKIRSICDTAGIPYRIDDMAVTKIGNTASAHLALSSKDIVGCGVAQHFFLSHKVNVLESGGVVIKDGMAIAPKGVGLGLEVNYEVLGEPKYTIK